MSDPQNPYARPSAWGSLPSRPLRVGPSKAATPAPPPPPARNTIFSGSAVPMRAPPPRAAPAPAPAAAPIPEPTPVSFAAPPPHRSRRNDGLRRRLPLAASLAVGVAGLAAVGWVLTRQPPPEPLPPVHAPVFAKAPAAPPRIEPVPRLAAAVETPRLRGRSPAQPAQVARAAPRPAPARTEPAAVVLEAPVLPLSAPPLVPQPAPTPPRAAAPPPTNADAPIATRAPYSE